VSQANGLNWLEVQLTLGALPRVSGEDQYLTMVLAGSSSRDMTFSCNLTLQVSTDGCLQDCTWLVWHTMARFVVLDLHGSARGPSTSWCDQG
jgi:hypothetical protein